MDLGHGMWVPKAVRMIDDGDFVRPGQAENGLLIIVAHRAVHGRISRVESRSRRRSRLVRWLYHQCRRTTQYVP
jgi:hypothetical protein